jgi:deazaflavin-dependent oxidoreductase (nitroreductase family)
MVWCSHGCEAPASRRAGDNPPVNGDPGGGAASLDALAAEDYLYLTTTGRVSGTPHRIEIWFALAGSTAYLLSGGGERSDWVRNLRAKTSVRVRIGARDFTATARIVDPGTEEDATARRMVFEKYERGYSGDLTGWRESALPVALDLDEGS